ncbi:hypothetical protein [Halomicrococcus sp. SG-WS-1]|uniref:hypothetical protein n=1 Tax=Halomicrococcus sp. SG-WS-1 TaxID=3439057 RepID=UPI003F79CDCA
MSGSSSGSDNPRVAAGVPDSLTDELASLDDDALRAVVGYARDLLNERLSMATLIEENDDEEIADIDERDGYTLVTKKQSCADGCEHCPHGPYLYRVRVEPSPTDYEPTLHWSFLGRVES